MYVLTMKKAPHLQSPSSQIKPSKTVDSLKELTHHVVCWWYYTKTSPCSANHNCTEFYKDRDCGRNAYYFFNCDNNKYFLRCISWSTIQTLLIGRKLVTDAKVTYCIDIQQVIYLLRQFSSWNTPHQIIRVIV